MIVTVIGLGLVGGSMALDLKRCAFASKVIGVDREPSHCEKAMELGLVDEIKNEEDAIWEADVVILAIPVNSIVKVLPLVLDKIGKTTVVTDVGSTKLPIVESVKNHPKRRRFVASHPMAGTEFSGPTAAIKNLFQEKVSIICNKEDSDDDAVQIIEKMYRSLYMEPLYMDAKEHDMHAAYVSHISHITSFVLATTVLDKEKSTKAIFDLASGGFSSTVRLAKSSPKTWTPIFLQNADNILEVMDTYIAKMQEFKAMLEDKNVDKLNETMSAANEIKRVLENK